MSTGCTEEPDRGEREHRMRLPLSGGQGRTEDELTNEKGQDTSRAGTSPVQRQRQTTVYSSPFPGKTIRAAVPLRSQGCGS